MVGCCPEGAQQLSGDETVSDFSTTRLHLYKSVPDYKNIHREHSWTILIITV